MAAAVIVGRLPFFNRNHARSLQHRIEPFGVVSRFVDVVFIGLATHQIEKPLAVICRQTLIHVWNCNPQSSAGL